MLAKFILFLLVLNPSHELNKDFELLAEVIGYLEDTGARYDIPPSRLAYTIERESGWNHLAVGKIPNRRGVILNEQGYCQAHGKAKKMCVDADIDITTRRGGIECLGYLINEGRTECGSIDAGIRWYASGSCNKAKKKMAERKKAWERQWNRVLNNDFEGKGAKVTAWRKKEQRKGIEVVSVNWGG